MVECFTLKYILVGIPFHFRIDVSRNMNDEFAIPMSYQQGCRSSNSALRYIDARVETSELKAGRGLATRAFQHIDQHVQLVSEFDEIQFHFVHQFLLVPILCKDFNWWTAVRVGEAKHPGPESFIDLCLVNPTALANRKNLLLSLQSDILCLAETSATALIQQEVFQSFQDTSYSIYWGHPVDDKVKVSALRDGKPSRRGEALGTAIFTRAPSRRSRIGDTTILHQSCRFTSCICFLGSCEVLLVSAYFFPGRTLDAQAKNDILVTHIYDYVLNPTLASLKALSAIQALGMLEGLLECMLEVLFGELWWPWEDDWLKQSIAGQRMIGPMWYFIYSYIIYIYIYIFILHCI